MHCIFVAQLSWMTCMFLGVPPCKRRHTNIMTLGIVMLAYADVKLNMNSKG